jgi:hypothetical protein
MSLQQSYLSQTGYGYDTVVAVDQSGLNGILKTYYSLAASKFTSVTMYFVKDSSGNAQAIDLATLLTKTSNIDPLTVKSTDTTSVNLLKNSPFYFAFKFTPGDPTSVAGWSYSYLKFIPGTQKVIYTLCCQNIQLVFFDTDSDTWVNESQTTTLYNINSTITLQNILSNNNLPANVQQELDDLGNAGLSVYQLLFDFDTAVIAPSTTIPVLSNTNSIFTPLVQQFIPTYFNAYNVVVSPVLNYSITQPNSATYINNQYGNSVIFAQQVIDEVSSLTQLFEDPVTTAWQQRSLLTAPDPENIQTIIYDTTTYSTHIEIQMIITLLSQTSRFRYGRQVRAVFTSVTRTIIPHILH